MLEKKRFALMAWVALIGSGVAACSGADVPSEDPGQNSGDPASTREELRGTKVCAGPRGSGCAEDRYCAGKVGRCPDERQRGRCAPRPDACYDIYAPVCGCDGKTYGNDCEAAAAGVSVASLGECAVPPAFCGGIAGIPCPEGQTCVDDPSDDCDPEHGGADCGGICHVAGEACGKVTCGPSTVCCNPLLGICTKPGMVCIQ